MENKIMKRAVEVALFVAAAICLFFMAGDDTPEAPMSTTRWIMVKVMAASVFLILVLAARYLTRKGWLPVPEEEAEAEWESQ